MIISFSGCSGSGKSTLIAGLTAKRGLLPHATIKHEDDFFIIRVAKLLFGSSLTTAYNTSRQFRKSDINRSKLFRIVDLIYPVVVISEYALLYFWYEVLAKDSILVTDRYPYDYYVTVTHNHAQQPNLITKALKNFPRPSIGFYLSIPSSLAIARLKTGSLNSRQDVYFFNKIMATYSEIAKDKGLKEVLTSGRLIVAIKEVSKLLELRMRFAGIKSISLSGTDGTGKSTTATLIKDSLKVINMRSKVLHFYHDTILYKLLKLIPGHGEILSKGIARKISKKGNFVWALVNYLDALVQTFAFRLIYHDQVIIYDRYFYDLMATYRFNQIFNASFFDSFFPAANKSYILLSSPEITFKRKPERSLAEIKEYREIYLNIAENEKLEVINTTSLTPEQVVDRILWP